MVLSCQCTRARHTHQLKLVTIQNEPIITCNAGIMMVRLTCRTIPMYLIPAWFMRDGCMMYSARGKGTDVNERHERHT